MSDSNISFTYIFIIICVCFGSSTSAQITVINSSFEDTPSDATIPQGWHACEERTTPDIFPGFWGVYTEPDEGETYVGIITRENSTFESFGQRLSAPVKKNECHEFYISLAHSDVYAGYNEAISLHIYLGDNKCDEDQLIFSSPIIKHTEWEVYKVKFKPKSEYQYIILKAFIKKGNFSHKGNILIDNMTSIKPCGQV